ncbi:MAG TPA: pentapeptide repeat-containing protein [Stellaceae bacterium]|nr:pentapeptide repeat-containing protein [Stellaceae bacterium]
MRHGVVGLLLKSVAWISLIAGPIALLVLFQLQYLPYHSEWITWWQRVAVVIDLVLLWILWPRIARGETAGLGWSDFKRVKVLAWLLASFLPFLLVVTIATFPGERLEHNLRLGSGWAKLHELLVAGDVNYVTGRPQSLWSNVLVLPNFEVGDRVKFDAEGKVAISSDALSLRGRSLEGAVVVSARLRKADFTGAQLASAKFSNADLRGAKFECELGSTPKSISISEHHKICAQLQGASLVDARLQGADVSDAHLQGALLTGSWLQGASLNGSQLQGASLYGSQLQGASLNGTQLQGASLVFTELQGAYLQKAQLEGALLRNIFVWRTNPPSDTSGAFVEAPEPEPGPKYSGPDCPFGEKPCTWTEKLYVALRSQIENSVPAGPRRDEALRLIATLEKPPSFADEASAKTWRDLAKEPVRSADSYFNTLAQKLKEIGCAADGAPYVIGRLIRRGDLDERFDRHPSQEAEVATAFLDEEGCLGALGLSEENKGKLQEIRNRGVSAPPGPGAAAR